MDVKVEKLPKNTVKLTIKVPADKVLHTYHHILEEFAQNTEIEGFRKGKAPKELVEKKIKQSKLNGETVNHLLREYYVQALKEHKVESIGNPRVEIKQFDKGKDFEFTATLPTRPEVKLGDYKKKLKEARALKSLKDPDAKVVLTIDDVTQTLLDSVDVEIPDMLVEDEVTRMLSRLLEQAETLGLGIDQYLSAQNKTAESLRKEYWETSKKNLRAEFALSKAIEAEGIKVEDQEIEDTINAIGDEKTRKEFQKERQRWYIISVLSKNKLIKKLIDGFKD